MSVVIKRPPAAPIAPPSAWRVASQLGWAEARRVVRHPATILGFVLAAWAMWALNTGQAPVLNRAGANTATPLVLLAGGGLVAVADSAVRLWKTERSEAIDVAPASARVRTLGLLLAAITPAVIALILQFSALGAMLFDQPVTSLDWWDTLTGPAVVAMASAAGVAAGRWVPSWFTGPLMLVVLGSGSVAVRSFEMRQSYGDWVAWLAPLVPLEFDPVEIAFRPTGLHLLYVVALVGVFTATALIRGSGRRGWLPTVALLLSLGAVVVLGASQAAAYADYDRSARIAEYLPPAAEYVCEEKGTVTYCAYPEYEPWIREWAVVVEPVLALAPEHLRDRALQVRQYPTRALDLFFDGSEFGFEDEPGLATGMWWGRGAGGIENRIDDAYPFGMALGTASWLVGLPLEPVAGTTEVIRDETGEIIRVEFLPGVEGANPDEITYRNCSTLDQGRAVVALWLAAQAGPVAEQHLRNLIEHSRFALTDTYTRIDGSGDTQDYFHLYDELGVGQPYPWYALSFHLHEAYYAHQLLDRPDEQVLELIHANWELLTDPSTTTLQAIEVLAVEPLAGFEEFDTESASGAGFEGHFVACA